MASHGLVSSIAMMACHSHSQCVCSMHNGDAQSHINNIAYVCVYLEMLIFIRDSTNRFISMRMALN